MHFWVWLSVAGLFVVLEVLTLSLVFISLAIAAAVGGLIAALWSGSAFQWIGFSITAVITLGFLRPIVRKYLFKKSGDTRTGFSALIGEEAIVLTEVSPTTGTINLGKETWTARTQEGSLPVGAGAKVVRIDGAVAIVTNAKEI